MLHILIRSANKFNKVQIELQPSEVWLQVYAICKGKYHLW